MRALALAAFGADAVLPVIGFAGIIQGAAMIAFIILLTHLIRTILRPPIGQQPALSAHAGSWLLPTASAAWRTEQKLAQILMDLAPSQE